MFLKCEYKRVIRRKLVVVVSGGHIFRVAHHIWMRELFAASIDTSINHRRVFAIYLEFIPDSFAVLRLYLVFWILRSLNNNRSRY